MANLRSATVLFALCSLLVGGKTLAADKPQQTGVSSERLDIPSIINEAVLPRASTRFGWKMRSAGLFARFS